MTIVNLLISSESLEGTPVGNPFELKAREQDDLVDAGGDGSPSVSSKNEETSTPPCPPESSDKLHVSANLLPASSYPVAPEPVIKCLQLVAGSGDVDANMLYRTAALCSDA